MKHIKHGGSGNITFLADINKILFENSLELPGARRAVKSLGQLTLDLFWEVNHLNNQINRQNPPCSAPRILLTRSIHALRLVLVLFVFLFFFFFSYGNCFFLCTIRIFYVIVPYKGHLYFVSHFLFLTSGMTSLIATRRVRYDLLKAEREEEQ